MFVYQRVTNGFGSKPNVALVNINSSLGFMGVNSPTFPLIIGFDTHPNGDEHGDRNIPVDRNGSYQK